MNWTTFDEIICRQRDFSIHRYFDEIIILLQKNCFSQSEILNFLKHSELMKLLFAAVTI